MGLSETGRGDDEKCKAPGTYSATWMAAFLDDAFSSGEVKGALARAGVNLLEYRRARNLDAAFDAACLELDDIIRISTVQAVEIEASAGNLGAVKLLVKGLGELCRPRTVPAPVDAAPGWDAEDLDGLRWLLAVVSDGTLEVPGLSPFVAAAVLHGWGWAEDFERRTPTPLAAGDAPDPGELGQFFGINQRDRKWQADWREEHARQQLRKAAEETGPEPLCPRCKKVRTAKPGGPDQCPSCGTSEK